jgi:hypothetical protein
VFMLGRDKFCRIKMTKFFTKSATLFEHKHFNFLNFFGLRADLDNLEELILPIQ